MQIISLIFAASSVLAAGANRTYNQVTKCPDNKAISADSYLTFKLIAVPLKYSCPPKDRAGYPVDGEVDEGADIFCPYPVNLGDDPSVFYCRFSTEDGHLTEDHNAQFCSQLTAVQVPDMDDTSVIDDCEGICDQDPRGCKGLNIYFDNYSNKGTTTNGQTDSYTCAVFKKHVHESEATNAGGQINAPSYGKKTTITHSKCFNLA